MVWGAVYDFCWLSEKNVAYKWFVWKESFNFASRLRPPSIGSGKLILLLAGCPPVTRLTVWRFYRFAILTVYQFNSFSGSTKIDPSSDWWWGRKHKPFLLRRGWSSLEMIRNKDYVSTHQLFLVGGAWRRCAFLGRSHIALSKHCVGATSIIWESSEWYLLFQHFIVFPISRKLLEIRFFRTFG